MRARGWLLLATALLLAACAGNAQPSKGAAQTAYDAAALPAGAQGELIRYGHELIVNTRGTMRPYITSNMDCGSCHVAGGTVPRGGSFVGIAAEFPQWNKRARRFITLQDRIAECFLYSMNGHPPPYSSRQMIAMVAYITYLSRGAAIGSKPNPSVKIASISLSNPNPARGSPLYTQKCSMCHGASGAGSNVFPALWGPTSFNNGAGMHRLRTMAGFVRYNMPANAPGTLSDRDAYDVAAYVLSHARPKFDRARMVRFPALAAGFF